MAVATYTVSADNITGIDAKAYFNRGTAMYSTGNYLGAIRQLTIASQMASYDVSLAEEIYFYLAMSHLKAGEKGSIEELETFIEKYPYSLHIPQVSLGLGDYFFYRGKYGDALRYYYTVNKESLSDDLREDLIYRTSYSELKTAEYDKAENGFYQLAKSKRYADASSFYRGYICYVRNKYDDALALFDNVRKSSDLKYNAQYYTAQIYYARSQYDDVIELGNKLLSEHQSNEFTPEINRIMGESYYCKNDYEFAEIYLNNYIQLCEEDDIPAMRSAYYALGVIAEQKGDTQGVVDNMNQVVGEEDAKSQSAYLYLGQAYVKQGNNNAATLAFEQAMNMDYNSDITETAFFNYAVAQNSGATTPFSKAINYFEDFLNTYPTSRYKTQVEDYLTNAYINGNDYSHALESINRIKKPSARVLEAKQYVLYNLGVNAYSNSQVDQADNYLTQAVALEDYGNNIYANCQFWLAECKYMQGQYPVAATNYQAYIDASSTTRPNHWLAYYDLGYCYFQQKDYTQARTAFTKATDASSILSSENKADAYSRIGDTYYYDKDFSKAQSYYSKSLNANTQSSDYAMYQQGMMQGLQKQYSTKISTMSKLIATYQNSAYLPQAYYEKSLAQMAQGDYTAASTTLESLIENHPGTNEARKGMLQLAINLREQGKESSAIEKYKRIISLYPSSDEALLALQDLKVIYADNGNMDELQMYLNQVPNAPQLTVNELDKLTFNAAEKAFLTDNGSSTKLYHYLKAYPNGAYAANAQYYISCDLFEKGDYDGALKYINSALSTSADASFAEDALSMKGAILSHQGNYEEAANTYYSLDEKATTTDNHISARLGALRANAQLSKHSEVITIANALLSGGSLSADEEQETLYLRADAYAHIGKTDDAEQDYTKLTKDMRTTYGAKGTFALAQLYYDNANYQSAESTINKLSESGTPHQYWVARAFILLSDVYVKQNKVFEAKQYLQSLKKNYPGDEADITEMINTRLEALKGNSAK